MAAAALAVVLGTAGLASAEEAISEEAKLYFRNGVELIQGSPPNYQDAYYQFKLAYEKSKSWKVLGNLGLCSFKLERDGEALDAYNEYLKSGGNEIDPEERKALERDVLVITGNSAARESCLERSGRRDHRRARGQLGSAADLQVSGRHARAAPARRQPHAHRHDAGRQAGALGGSAFARKDRRAPVQFRRRSRRRRAAARRIRRRGSRRPLPPTRAGVARRSAPSDSSRSASAARRSSAAS